MNATYNAVMSRAVEQLWEVAQGAQHIDATALAGAVESAAAAAAPGSPDYRTRLLLRDSLAALERHWGRERFNQWLERCPVRDRIRRACAPECFDDDPNEIGFPSLSSRVMDPTRPETVLEFFKVLSLHVRTPTQLTLGRSLALILRGLLSRRTEDADVVNEVPAALRNQHDALNDLASRFGIQLTHFQSHYLPDSWDKRVQLWESFDNLDVYLLDPFDIVFSKLCSKRA